MSGDCADCGHCNTVKISAVGESLLKPKRCRLVVTISHTKQTAEQVKTSISRRAQYIEHVFSNFGVKGFRSWRRSLVKTNELESEEDISSTEAMNLTAEGFRMRNEISVIFDDFCSCQAAYNLLQEKLDDSSHGVTFAVPVFLHSSQDLDALRRQSSLNAVKNAHAKAQDMASFFNQYIVRPISITELGVEESANFGTEWKPDNVESFSKVLEQSTIIVKTKVEVVFETKARAKRDLT